jgi:hypothetical protein
VAKEAHKALQSVAKHGQRTASSGRGLAAPHGSKFTSVNIASVV